MAAAASGLALALALAQAIGVGGTGGGGPSVVPLSAEGLAAALEPGGCSGPLAVFYGTGAEASAGHGGRAPGEGEGEGELGARCCRCGDGSAAWSASGACSPCRGDVELRARAPPGCDPAGEGFLGSRRCVSECRAVLAEAEASAPGAGATDAEALAFFEFGAAAQDLRDFACFGAVSCLEWPDLCLEQNVRRTPAVVSYPPNQGSSRFHFGNIEKQSLVRLLLSQAEPRDLTQQITLENIQQFLASPLKPLKVLLFSEEPVSRGFANMALLSSDKALRPHVDFGFVSKTAAAQLLKRFGIAEVPTIILQRGMDSSSRKVLSGAAWIFDELRMWLVDYVQESAMRGGLNAVREPAPQAWRPAPRRPAANEQVPELHRESFETLRASKADLLVYVREGELEDQEAKMLAALQQTFGQQLASSRVRLSWAWLDLEQEPLWLDAFGVHALPTAVYVKPNRNPRFAALAHEKSASGRALPADAASIRAFLDEVLAGSMKFRPLQAAQLSQWSDRSAAAKPGAAAGGAAGRRKARAKYRRLEYGAGGCPPGQEIRSAKECEKAIKSLGLKTEPKWSSNYGGVPRWCSVREGSSKSSPERLHFNSAKEGQGRADLAPVCHVGSSAAEGAAPATEGDAATADSGTAAAAPEGSERLASRAEKERGEVHDARARQDAVRDRVSEALAGVGGVPGLEELLQRVVDQVAQQEQGVPPSGQAAGQAAQGAPGAPPPSGQEEAAPAPQEQPAGLQHLTRHTRRPLFGQPGSWLLYFSDGELAPSEEAMLARLQEHLRSHREAGALRFAWMNPHDEPELFGLFGAHGRGVEALPSAVLLQAERGRVRFLPARHQRRAGAALPVDEKRLKVLLAEALVEEPDFTPWTEWPEGQRR